MRNKTDEWVKRAFEDAMDAPFDDPSEEAEYQAYQNIIVNNATKIMMYCGNIVGNEKMNRLARILSETGNVQVFAEFTKAVATVSFSEGYEAGRNERND